MKANMRFLKSARLSGFLIMEPKLLHSSKVEGMKEILKYSCLTLNKAILFLCLVIYACLAAGSEWYFGDWFEKETKSPLPPSLL